MNYKSITMVVNGRFHAFDYARVLSERGLLKQLISTMPNAVARRYDIPDSTYIGMPWMEVLKRGWRIAFRTEPPAAWYSRIFINSAFKTLRMSHSNTIIAFAGYAGFFGKKELNSSFKILDRGSTHTLVNKELNQKACEWHGLKYKSHSSNFINSEMQEYEWADRILVPGSFVENSFLNKGVNSEKIIKIPYGTDSRRINLTTTVKKQSSDEKRVLFVGSVSPRKGFGVLYEAMNILTKSYKSLRLIVAGPVDPKIPKRFLNATWLDMKGKLTAAELVPLYTNCDLFCLPSFEEGLPLVITEAYNFGIPIVATRNTSASDLIKGDNDSLNLEAGNVEQLAKAMENMLFNTPLNSVHYSVNFKGWSWDDFVDKLILNIP